jgi:hypothetical protein
MRDFSGQCTRTAENDIFSLEALFEFVKHNNSVTSLTVTSYYPFSLYDVLAVLILVFDGIPCCLCQSLDLCEPRCTQVKDYFLWNQLTHDVVSSFQDHDMTLWTRTPGWNIHQLVCFVSLEIKIPRLPSWKTTTGQQELFPRASFGFEKPQGNFTWKHIRLLLFKSLQYAGSSSHEELDYEYKDNDALESNFSSKILMHLRLPFVVVVLNLDSAGDSQSHPHIESILYLPVNLFPRESLRLTCK